MNKKSNVITLLCFYLVIILIVYVWPTEASVKLNKIHLFSFRADHILHLLCFIPLPFLIYLSLFSKTNYFTYLKTFITSITIAVLFEIVHYMLPYRSFTFADLMANSLGVIIGWISLLIFSSKKKSDAKR